MSEKISDDQTAQELISRMKSEGLHYAGLATWRDTAGVRRCGGQFIRDDVFLQKGWKPSVSNRRD